MVTWRNGRVTVADSVAGAPSLTGAQLRDLYWAAVRDITFGLTRGRRNSIVTGPIEMFRFSQPRVGAHSVEWKVEGGLLVREPGGTWRVSAEDGTVSASLEGFRPSLPRPLYAISHLQVHLLFVRLFLLRARGEVLRPGIQVSAEDRQRAALVDVAFCLTLTRLAGLRLRPKTVLAVLAGYHIACWSTSGRTLGGAVVGQRVVATDGRRLLPAQAALRLALLPLSWITRRPIHDQIASTEVIKG